MKIRTAKGDRHHSGRSSGKRRRGRGGGEMERRLAFCRPATGEDDAAPERRAGGEGVDPGHGVGPVGSRGAQRRQELVESVVAPALLDDPRRRHALQGELDLEDVAGEPHAAERGAEEPGVLSRGRNRRCGRRRGASAAPARAGRSCRRDDGSCRGRRRRPCRPGSRRRYPGSPAARSRAAGRGAGSRAARGRPRRAARRLRDRRRGCGRRAPTRRLRGAPAGGSDASP